MSTPKPDPSECIWKPPVRKKIDGELKMLRFPCRYPEKEKTAETCNPCLLGDLFAMQFTQMQSTKQQTEMSDEIMQFLRNLTSDGSLDDFK